jgi:hypothetical protein
MFIHLAARNLRGQCPQSIPGSGLNNAEIKFSTLKAKKPVSSRHGSLRKNGRRRLNYKAAQAALP